VRAFPKLVSPPLSPALSSTVLVRTPLLRVGPLRPPLSRLSCPTFGSLKPVDYAGEVVCAVPFAIAFFSTISSRILALPEEGDCRSIAFQTPPLIDFLFPSIPPTFGVQVALPPCHQYLSDFSALFEGVRSLPAIRRGVLRRARPQADA